MNEIEVLDAVPPALDAQSSAVKACGDSDLEADPPGDVRVGRLDTLQGVRTEMSRVYRAARKVAGHRPTPADATKLGWLLNSIGQTILSADVAARLDALEKRINNR